MEILMFIMLAAIRLQVRLDDTFLLVINTASVFKNV